MDAGFARTENLVSLGETVVRNGGRPDTFFDLIALLGRKGALKYDQLTDLGGRLASQPETNLHIICIVRDASFDFTEDNVRRICDLVERVHSQAIYEKPTEHPFVPLRDIASVNGFSPERFNEVLDIGIETIDGGLTLCSLTGIFAGISKLVSNRGILTPEHAGTEGRKLIGVAEVLEREIFPDRKRFSEDALVQMSHRRPKGDKTTMDDIIDDGLRTLRDGKFVAEL